MSSLINWFIDSIAGEDVIDLYFILSNLVDIDLTEAESCETACYDSLASSTTLEKNSERSIPLGKRVY